MFARPGVVAPDLLEPTSTRIMSKWVAVDLDPNIKRKVQRISKTDADLLDVYILSRPFCLLIRQPDKSYFESRYCANADDLLVNFVYERLKAPRWKHNCFKLAHTATEPDGTEVWTWSAVTVVELRQIIDRAVPAAETADAASA